jgi:hypothetical protein
VNPVAYVSYLKGRFFWNKRTADGLKVALAYFDQAIDEDANYAQAYSGLADTYALLGDWQYAVMTPKEALPKAKAAAIKALELDETVAEAHVALADVKKGYDWDWVGAEAEYKRALQLNPSYSLGHYLYADFLSKMKRHDEAIAQASTLRCRWVACAEGFGRDTTLLDQIAGLGAGRIGWAVEQDQLGTRADRRGDLVQVDAVVMDKDGKPVTDLRSDEVQIFEDGKLQKITHFAYNVTGTESANRTGKPLATVKSNEVAPPVAPKRLNRENVQRTIAIVVDDLGLSFESAHYMRRALKKIVDEQIQPGDLVAILRTARLMFIAAAVSRS